ALGFTAGETRGNSQAAGGLFTAALLCKENVLLLPLLRVWPASRPATWRARLWRAAPLIVPGVLLLVYLGIARAGTRTFGGASYAVGFGLPWFHNLMTYLDWSVDLRTPIPDLVGAASADAWRLGLPLAIALAGFAAWAWPRTRLVAFGTSWWLLSLVPVLPLLHHDYLFYLYAPCA